MPVALGPFHLVCSINFEQTLSSVRVSALLPTVSSIPEPTKASEMFVE